MMNPPVPSSTKANTFDLLTYYSLDTDHYPHSSKGEVLDRWLQMYPEPWVRMALIESLYQGRYKTFSVEQLLALWNRRGQPVHHFSFEFAALVTHDVPRIGPDSPLPPNGSQMAEPKSHSVDPWLENEIEPQSLDPNSSLISAEMGESDPSEAFSEEPDSQRFVNRLGLDPFLDDGFDTSGDTRPSVLITMTDHQHLLSGGRMGLVPIHQFMPEAEPVEFCEKLAAIAHTQF